MRYLKLTYLIPAFLLVLVTLLVVKLVEVAGDRDWRWLTLLVSCYGVMLAVPLLFWPSVAGWLTVILLKEFGLGGAR